MADGLIDTLAEHSGRNTDPGFGVAPGVVMNNLDSTGECRVQVHIPSKPGFDPWARLSCIGAGSERGFAWVPQIGDEVLVAFAQNDPVTAYVLGGLWSTLGRPPITAPPQALTTRVIKTGVAAGVGHEISFDDALQSVTITTSTMQKITMAPDKLELSAAAGAMTVTMDTATQAISITSPLKVAIQATQISLQGTTIELQGTTINIESAGPCSIKGLPIQLN